MRIAVAADERMGVAEADDRANVEHLADIDGR
jgi:hypothetical protein